MLFYIKARVCLKYFVNGSRKFYESPYQYILSLEYSQELFFYESWPVNLLRGLQLESTLNI